MLLEAKPGTYTHATKDIERRGPKPAPLAPDTELGFCVACREPFQPGDYTGWVGLGPGKDRETRRAAREGLPYAGVLVEVHWACLTGRED
jgi:hypothetical protein